MRFIQPICGKFLLLHGYSLADKSKLVLLSLLAVVAVNQGLARTFPSALSVRVLVVWESGRGTAADWTAGETCDPFLLVSVSVNDTDWLD